jgi:hypothetical protein
MSTGATGSDGSARQGTVVPALTAGAGVVLVLLLVGIGVLLQERNSAAVAAVTATVTATTAAATTPVPTLAPTQTIVIGAVPSPTQPAAASAAPTATATPTPAARRVFIVANTDGDGVNLRREPSPAGEVVAALSEGTRLEQIGPDRESGGRTWRNVRDSAGNQGWLAANFTRAAP